MRISRVTLTWSAAFAISLVLAGTGAFAATVYKWVDENGVTHYSDQPHQNAQTVDVQAAQTYQAAAVAPASAGSAPAAAQPETTTGYRVCELSRPENDEVFLNTHTVTARLRLEPELRRGDRVAFGVDGKRMQTSDSTAATLDVERGTHSLMAVVEDASGKAVCTAATVTFHVRQPSKLAPNPANRPRF